MFRLLLGFFLAPLLFWSSIDIFLLIPPFYIRGVRLISMDAIFIVLLIIGFHLLKLGLDRDVPKKSDGTN